MLRKTLCLVSLITFDVAALFFISIFNLPDKERNSFLYSPCFQNVDLSLS